MKKKKKVKCKDVELKNRIEAFLKRSGWEYEDFSFILATAGITHPVSVRKGEDYNLVVVTGEGIDYKMDLIEDQSMFTVKFSTPQENIEKLYLLTDKEEGVKRVLLRQILCSIGDNVLNCQFDYGKNQDETFWRLDMPYPDENDIVEHYDIEVKNKNLPLQPLDEVTRIINSMLLNVRKDSSFDEVYGNLIELMLETNMFDIAKFYEVTHFGPSSFEIEEVWDKIKINEGKFSEYARTKEGITTHIKEGGDWIYRVENGISGSFKVEYDKVLETYEYNSLGIEDGQDIQKLAILKGKNATEELLKILETEIVL